MRQKAWQERRQNQTFFFFLEGTMELLVSGILRRKLPVRLGSNVSLFLPLQPTPSHPCLQ